ncbi:MAG: ATPase domain-containing protein [Candidatus Bathyarchaeia archaeon]
MQTSSTPVKTCPLCGEASAYDDLTGFYFCNHCDQFIQWVPDSYALILTGPAGAGKTPSFHAWSDFYLRNGRPVVLFAFDDFPSNIRGAFSDYYQQKLPEYEKAGIVTIVDCYSSIAGVPSQEKYSLKNRADLNELSLMVSDLLNEKAKLGKTKFIIDSVTPLFTYKEPQVVVQFLASTAVKVKAKGAALAVSLTSGTVNEETFRRLETLMDFALEIRFVEEEGRKKRLMRFVKARGQRIYEEWVPIYIGSKTISIDVGEDPKKYERLKKALYAKPS